MKFFVLLFTLLTIPWVARAEFTIDTSVFYYSDSFTEATSKDYGMTMWSASLNFEVAKSKWFYAGWNVMSAEQSYTTTTTTTFSSMEMGPRFMYLSKSKTWELAVSYHLSSTNATTYNPGTGTTATLKGSALFVEFGYLPEIQPNWHLGFKLNYYAPSFAEKITNNTTYTQISYSRTTIYPALALSLMW